MSERLLTVAEWVALRPDLYPAEHAFDWRWRVHKRIYIEAGAVLLIGGRRMIDPSACERVELEIGRAEAMALLDRAADT